MRALTGLRQAGIAAQQSEAAGQALEMPLGRIHPDPENARRPEDESSPEGLEQQKELTADIRKRGVKSPVSLRPHPTIAGEYMLNFGHRRFKGALEAGLATIPCFIDVHFDSYDQVKENLLHRKPSIWALAQFVQRKLSAGQSKAEIAEGLGKANQNLVTELVALVDAPACLHQAYAGGVTSTRTLYDLRRAYDEYPEPTERWCATTEKVTRETIRAFLSGMQTAGATGPVAGTGAVTAVPGLTDPVSPEPRGVVRGEQGAESAAVSAGQRLRHDVKGALPPYTPLLPGAKPMSAPDNAPIAVQYQGKLATVAPGATVVIAMDHDQTVLTVPLAELVFLRTS